MVKISEIATTAPHLLISAASQPAGHSVVASHAGDGSVTKALQPAHQPALDTRCLWCGRDFTPRATGGSAQKFCCIGHRQEFWIAARRWTMRAIDAGLLSVDCLKASHTSVHAHRTRVREVRIQFPPADSPSLAGFLLPVSQGRRLPRRGRAGPGGTAGRDAQGSSTSRQLPATSLSGPIPVPQCRLGGSRLWLHWCAQARSG